MGHDGAGTGKGNGTMGHGKDSGGGYEQALYGKGLIAGQVGGGQGDLGSVWGNGRRGTGSFGTKGKGGGHEGYGTSRLGSGARSFSYPVTEEAMVEGGLDREAVILVVMKNIGQITYCYELGLQKKPELRGRVLVDFTINGQGKVASNSISSSTLRSSQVENCMLSKIKNWKFPHPVGGVNVDVNYPFALQRVSEVSQNLTAK
jgi:TonB family protein